MPQHRESGRARMTNLAQLAAQKRQPAHFFGANRTNQLSAPRVEEQCKIRRIGAAAAV